jgi:hypothetical protein
VDWDKSASTLIETVVVCVYDKTMGRTIGDTNYDCNVNLVDLASMASYWLTNVSH